MSNIGNTGKLVRRKSSQCGSALMGDTVFFHRN